MRQRGSTAHSRWSAVRSRGTRTTVEGLAVAPRPGASRTASGPSSRPSSSASSCARTAPPSRVIRRTSSTGIFWAVPGLTGRGAVTTVSARFRRPGGSSRTPAPAASRHVITGLVAGGRPAAGAGGGSSGVLVGPVDRGVDRHLPGDHPCRRPVADIAPSSQTAPSPIRAPAAPLARPPHSRSARTGRERPGVRARSAAEPVSSRPCWSRKPIGACARRLPAERLVERQYPLRPPYWCRKDSRLRSERAAPACPVRRVRLRSASVRYTARATQFPRRLRLPRLPGIP